MLGSPSFAGGERIKLKFYPRGRLETASSTKGSWNAFDGPISLYEEKRESSSRRVFFSSHGGLEGGKPPWTALKPEKGEFDSKRGGSLNAQPRLWEEN